MKKFSTNGKIRFEKRITTQGDDFKIRYAHNKINHEKKTKNKERFKTRL